jgi:uncharacterized membrane protein YbhN (UPF0104 family)/tRNA A-37 threonylcarbamoyl transferase component Bud32
VGDQTSSSEEEIRRYQRSPADLLRLAVFVALSLVAVGAAIWIEDSILGLEEDLIRLVDFVSPTIERILSGTVEWIVALVGLAILIVPPIRRRFRLWGYLVAALVLANAVMQLVDAAIGARDTPVLVNELARRAGLKTPASDSLGVIAQLTACFVVLGPFVSSRWRRAGATLLAAIVAAQLLITVHLPVDVVVALPVGAAVGCAILAAFGRPDVRPTIDAIHAALVDSGIVVHEVHAASVDARGSTPYFATTDTSGVFVKVLGTSERAADLMFRAYRFVRLKDVGDDRPFSSLRRTVEHEALVSLYARDVGVATPRLRSVSQVGVDSMLLAYDRVEGTSLDAVPAADVTDDLMRSVWRQVAVLREHRIAHRDLRQANVVVDADRTAWIIDFGFSELAVSDPLLDADVAQLLASFSLDVGPERAVAVAIEVLGRDAVSSSLPRLQLNALSGATRTSLKRSKGSLRELQTEVVQQCAVADVHYEELERFDKRTLLTVAIVIGATYFLFPQFADLPDIIQNVEDADWSWVPLAVVASVISYLGAGASLAGAVVPRLPGGPVMAAQLASSFASKLAPSALGGMALNIRFLQKHGVERTPAVSAVGLSTVAGLVSHVSLIAVFVLWAGTEAFGSFQLPNPRWFVVGAAVAAVFAGIGFAIPFTRHLIVGRIVPIIRTSVDGLGQVLRTPAKVALLLGGSAVVTVSYIVSVYFSIEAFGGGLSFATVGAVYLLGSAVATAAPTPGGLGAMEAALIGGLVAAGLDNSAAVPAVFLFRLCTFWLPILPGWIAFTWLQHRDHI